MFPRHQTLISGILINNRRETPTGKRGRKQTILREREWNEKLERKENREKIERERKRK